MCWSNSWVCGSLGRGVSALGGVFGGSTSFAIHRVGLGKRYDVGSTVVAVRKVYKGSALTLSMVGPLLSCCFSYRSPSGIFSLVGGAILASDRVIRFAAVSRTVDFSASNFTLLIISNYDHVLTVKTRNFSFEDISRPRDRMIRENYERNFARPLEVGVALVEQEVGDPSLIFRAVADKCDSGARVVVYCLRGDISGRVLGTVERQLRGYGLGVVLTSKCLDDCLRSGGSGSLFSNVKVSREPSAIYKGLSRNEITVLVSKAPSIVVVPRLFTRRFRDISSCSGHPCCTTFVQVLGCVSFLVTMFLPKVCATFTRFRPRCFPAKLLIGASSSLSRAPLPMALRIVLVAFVCRIVERTKLHVPGPLKRTIDVIKTLMVNRDTIDTNVVDSSALVIITATTVYDCIAFTLCPPVVILEFFYIVTNKVFNL